MTPPSHVTQVWLTGTDTCDWCHGLIWSTYWLMRLGTWDQVCLACGDKRGWVPIQKEEELRYTL